MRNFNFLSLCITLLFAVSAVPYQSLFVGDFEFIDLLIFSTDEQGELFHSSGKLSFNDTRPANVNRLNLSQDVVFINCNSKLKRCSESKEAIDVWTEARDPEGDVLTYKYTVSGGKIAGDGEKVVWDLSNVKAGEYTITAGVDDSCGACGITRTRKVSVVECPNEIGAKSFPENISKFNLNRTEIFASCRNGKICSREDHLIKISTALSNPSDSKSIFRYQVSGGRIIGNGTEVEWDLSKVEAGNYSITVSADVGRGFCGNQISQPIRVVKCPRCK